jgi:hypothetical protein
MSVRFLFCLLFSLGFSQTHFAQGDSEVYLVDIDFAMDGFTFQNIRNISDNPGYDNQPFFQNNDLLLYARNHKEQTDIANFSLNNNTFEWQNKVTQGGEYSPQPIPNSADIAAVRLDPDGKQRLYRYTSDGTSTELIPNLEVAYFTFFDSQTLVASILAGDNLDLIIHHFMDNTTYTLLKKSGRSIHAIPNSKAVSYPAINEEGNLDIYQLDMNSLDSYFICQLPIGIQDYVWWDDYKILIGSGTKLFVYDLYGNGDWQQVADFSAYPLQNITRLSISPDQKHLAFVAEPKS